MRKGWCVTIALLIAVAGCTTIQVSQDYDPAADFTTLATFDWYSPTQPQQGDPRIDNPLLDGRIRAAVVHELNRKGFTWSAAEAPSFRVRYTYLLRSRVDSWGPGMGISVGIGSYGSHGGIAVSSGTATRIDTVDEAVLVIDVLAAAADTLLWRGTGSEMFRAYDDPAEATAAIDRLVGRIMQPFPPGD